MRDWDLEGDGPVDVSGDWEVFPEGLLLDEDVTARAPSNDFVSLPWSEAHHTTRAGLDVDASRWLAVRVRLRLPKEASATVLEFGELGESFRADCRDDTGRRSALAAGLNNPRDPTVFPVHFDAAGNVGLAGDGSCVITVPRASRGRVVALTAPRMVLASLSGRSTSGKLGFALVNLALMGCFVVFASILARLDRHDRLPRLAAAFSAFTFVRIVLVNRATFFIPAELEAYAGVINFRVEYADLWLLFVAFGLYTEELARRPLPFRAPIFVLLFALAAVAMFAPYPVNRSLLPLGQAAGLAVLSGAAYNLARLRDDRAARFALAGIGVALIGALGTIVSVALSGFHSPQFEALASLEPLFQMAVLAVRTTDARQKSAALARATQYFVPREFLHALGHDDVTTAKLGDVSSREVTVLFADIRNFTSLSERMSPEQTFAFLNKCLSKIGPHIRSHSGFIDKYIGDAIMAIFPGSPADAVRAAVAMQHEVSTFNAAAAGGAPLAIGIGIHLGHVMMGTIGEAERFEATVIGDAVNLTARLESLTKQIGCSALISEEVFATLDAELRTHTRRLGTFIVKGKAQPVTLYEVFASDSDSLRDFKLGTRDRFESMLTAFASEQMDVALAIASELRDACPEDGPANWWFMRLVKESALGDEAVPSSRGIVRLDEK